MARVHLCWRRTVALLLPVRAQTGLAMALLPLVAGCVLTGAPGMVGSSGTLASDYSSSSDPLVLYPTPTPDPTLTQPSIIKLAANPTTVTGPGQAIALTCEAVDSVAVPGYAWSATSGTLSATQGQTVSWTPPAQAGNYAVTVLVSVPSGGAVTGAFTLSVNASGSTTLTGTDPVNPTPTPAPLPTPQSYSQQPDNGYLWNDYYGNDSYGADPGGYYSDGCSDTSSTYTSYSGPYGSVTVSRDRYSCY